MKYLKVLVAGALLCGASDFAMAADVTFKVTDVPGHWFDTGVDIAGTRSLAIVTPGTTIHFHADSSSQCIISPTA